MKFRTHLLLCFFLAVIGTSALRVGLGQNDPSLDGFPERAFELPKVFLFQEGDSPDWKDPGYDDRGWKGTPVPGVVSLAKSNADGRYWYRVSFDSPSPSSDELGLLLGRIGDIDETYLNGHLLGRTGRFYPDGSAPVHKVRVYRIPSDWLKTSGQNLLAIRCQNIWGLHIGLYRGHPVIGDYALLQRAAGQEYFLASTLGLFFACFSLFMGLYHLYLYLRLPSKRLNLLYFFFSLVSSCFMLSLGFKTIEWWSSPSLILRVHALAGIGTILLLHVYTLGATQKRVAWPDRLILGANLIFLVAVLVPTNYRIVYAIFNTWYPMVLVSLIYLCYVTIRFAYKGRSDLSVLAAAMVFVLLTAIADVLYGLRILDFIQFSAAGSFALNLGIMFALAHDFTAAYLNVEEQVGARTKELSHANDELRSMEQMKRRFFANVSHDLKTPITVALGVMDGVAADAKTILAPARANLNKLLTMVQQLLDMVRAESGELILHWENVKVGPSIRNWAESFAAHCRRQKIKLDVRADGFDILEVPMDSLKIQRVLDNLLGNAIKFAKSAIRVSIKTDEARVFLMVEDDGPGIPDDEFERVFDRYYQSRTNDLRAHGGSGIGLSFVKEIVELHNGTAWAEKGDLGGARFTVTLPLAQDVDIVRSYVPTEKPKPDELQGSLDVAFPPSVPARILKRAANVLLVEDNPEVAQVIVQALAQDFNVYFASSGEPALRILEEHPVECVLSDVMMPGMNGTQLLREIRSRPQFKQLPVLMLTSRAETQDIVDHLTAGANDYVTKPFRKEVLVARVKTQIAAARTIARKTHISKLAELGMLSAGLAHESRNRMMNLPSGISMFEKVEKEIFGEAPLTPERKAKLHEIYRMSLESARLSTDKVMTFLSAMNGYSSGSSTKQTIRVAEAVENALALAATPIRHSAIQVEKHGLEDLSFEGYGEFSQAIVNVVNNAVYAIAKVRKPREGILKFTGQDLGDAISLEVRDNGMGIEPEVLPHVFEALFTTKPTNEGTGLGLSLARDFIELKHNGQLQVTSAGQGQGASFTFIVPKVAPDLPEMVTKVHGVRV